MRLVFFFLRSPSISHNCCPVLSRVKTGHLSRKVNYILLPDASITIEERAIGGRQQGDRKSRKRGEREKKKNVFCFFLHLSFTLAPPPPSKPLQTAPSPPPRISSKKKKKKRGPRRELNPGPLLCSCFYRQLGGGKESFQVEPFNFNFSRKENHTTRPRGRQKCIFRALSMAALPSSIPLSLLSFFLSFGPQQERVDGLGSPTSLFFSSSSSSAPCSSLFCLLCGAPSRRAPTLAEEQQQRLLEGRRRRRCSPSGRRRHALLLRRRRMQERRRRCFAAAAVASSSSTFLASSAPPPPPPRRRRSPQGTRPSRTS